MSNALSMLNGETRLYPIIGDPIVYVKSPQRLSENFAAQGHNALCVPMQVGEEALRSVMCGFNCIPNIDGLLITMPHKFKAVEHCATLSERARLLGVVSVMRRNNDGSWHGDMLDGLAFVKAQIDQGARLDGARVLLVGAGGAGSAIAVAMMQAGVRELSIQDTDLSRVSHLLSLLRRAINNGIVSAANADPTGFDVVCNATPMGMRSSDPMPVAAELLTRSMFVGDVVAGHGVTAFLQAARAKGCKTADGAQMVEAVQQMQLDFLLGKAHD